MDRISRSTLIPVDNIKELEDYAKKITRRKAKGRVDSHFEYAIHDTEVLIEEPFTIWGARDRWGAYPDARTINVKTPYKWFTVDAEIPKMNGYSFVGSYFTEVDKEGKDIYFFRSLPDVEVPEKYFYIKDKNCDHCNTKRDRKNLYLFKHEDGDYKVIGSTCLTDYTGHKDPEHLVKLLDHLINNTAYDPYAKESNPDFYIDEYYTPSTYTPRAPTYVDVRDALAIASAIIDVKGFVSMASSDEEPSTNNYLRYYLTDYSSVEMGIGNPWEGEIIAKRHITKLIDITDKNYETADRLIDLIKESPTNNYMINVKRIIDAGHVSFDRNLPTLIGSFTLIEKDNRRILEEKIKNEKAEAKASLPDVEEGRYEISGLIKLAVVKSYSFSAWNSVETIKVKIIDDLGREYYGSMPSKLIDNVTDFYKADEKGFIHPDVYSDSVWDYFKEIEGKKVTLKGTVERSKKDSKFGFYKRPHGFTIS